MTSSPEILESMPGMMLAETICKDENNSDGTSVLQDGLNE